MKLPSQAQCTCNVIPVLNCPSPYHWYKHVESLSVYLISSVQCLKALNQQLQLAVVDLNGASFLPESKHGQQTCLQYRIASVELHLLKARCCSSALQPLPLHHPFLFCTCLLHPPISFCPPHVGPWFFLLLPPTSFQCERWLEPLA